MKIPAILKKIDFFVVLIIVYALWLLSLKNRQTGGMDDFDIFFKAGERLLNGENIYGPPHYYNLMYFYSVLFAGIMALLQGLDINTVKWIWFILNSFLLIRVIFLLRTHIISVNKNQALVLFLLLLLFGKIVLINYTFNQITILIVWTMLEAFDLLKKGKMPLAVLLLCLGINIKIMPIVLVPYFLYISEKRWQMLVLGLVFLALFLYLPAVFIGWDYNNMLIGEWLNTLNPVSRIHVIQTYEFGFTDISSMVSKFLSDEEVYLEPKLNFASLSISTVFLIVNLIRILFLAAALYLAFKIKSAIRGIHHHIIVVSAFMALIPLCFPHQREYSYLCFIPLVSILLSLLFQTRNLFSIIIFAILTVFSGMLVWVDFAGETVVNVFKHYRLITMGMCLMFIYYVGVVTDIYGKSQAPLKESDIRVE